jgi:hypothetical protein
MFSLFSRKCAFLDRERRPPRVIVATVGAAMVASALSGPPALASMAPTRPIAAAGGADELDTEDVFGFVEGADIGHLGGQEAEVDTSLRSGKSSGTYNSAATAFEYKYTAFTNFRISTVATFAIMTSQASPGSTTSSTRRCSHSCSMPAFACSIATRRRSA